MKCELAAALLHRPRVLFLDEPTIGLDVTMQTNIRRFVAEYNTRWNATIILTSHYMADVVALCKRVIVINDGKLLYDGDLQAMAERIAPYKLLRVDFAVPAAGLDLAAYGEVRRSDGQNAELLIPREHTSSITARLLAELPVSDLTIEEPAIEEIIGRVFAGESAAAEPSDAS